MNKKRKQELRHISEMLEEAKTALENIVDDEEDLGHDEICTSLSDAVEELEEVISSIQELTEE